MVGKTIETCSTGSPTCKYGLPEPSNSDGAIYDKPMNGQDNRVRSNNNREQTEENDRVPSGRIRDRVIE